MRYILRDEFVNKYLAVNTTHKKLLKAESEDETSAKIVEF
ncbi:hypothetical protein EW026_g6126 [Hermanssonia centrifuga]|uniref:Uncharacterized protein n=1 Tax=Hermanssonia centrifuga TaxID=98765 RepID=A0A4S4KGD7_9APHY|nr:hypothetical protein EW026_g6126 [Hermanssonia centrifuga]